MIKLSKRLKEIAAFTTDSDTVADIGTDHGYLPVYLAQTNSNRRIIASDISSGSLNAAYKSALKYDVTEAITLITAFGLDGVSPDDVNTVVIAGLGGETIVSILKNAEWTRQESIKLILQPQSKPEILSRYLYDNEYKIHETKYIRDRYKLYKILLVGRNT